LNVRYDLSWQALDGAPGAGARWWRRAAGDRRLRRRFPEGRRLTGAGRRPPENAPRRNCARGNAGKTRLSLPRWRWSIRRRWPAGPESPSWPTPEARVLLGRRFPQRCGPRHTLTRLAERRLVRGASAGRETAGAAKLFSRDRRAAATALSHEQQSGAQTTAPRRGVVAPRRERRPWLLLCGSDPAVTDGHRAEVVVHRSAAKVQQGERLAVGPAAREAGPKETGLRVDPADMVGPIWRRDEVFEFKRLDDRQRRSFYLVHRTRRFEPSMVGRTELGTPLQSTVARWLRTRSRHRRAGRGR